MTANYFVKVLDRGASPALRTFPRISCHIGRHFVSSNGSCPYNLTERPMRPIVALLFLILFALQPLVGFAQDTSRPSQQRPEGDMTLARMGEIILRLDPEAKEVRPGTWEFRVTEFSVMVVTAEPANRMRVMVRVRGAENLSQAELLRIAQANLDTALDARYAVGNGALWAAFIHPLSSLHTNQFIEAIGSTVNLAATYGTTYSSGLLSFRGGDSTGILQRKLIDELLEKGGSRI